MSARLVSIALVMVAMFVISLMISYYGFQVSPDIGAQIFTGDINTICKDTNQILESRNLTYPQVIRAISDETGLRTLGLNSQDISTIEKCLQGRLPSLGSTLESKKIGFFEGVNGHSVKGKSIIISIEKTNYLRLENFEIGYEIKQGKEFKVPELHVYLTKGNIRSPEIYLDKLNTELGNKNYKLPDVDLNIYHTVVIYDEIHKEPFAKIKLEDPFYLRDTVRDLVDRSITVDFPKFESRILYERHGFFEGVDNFKAKGSVKIDYLEDEGTLEINSFEITKGEDLRLYLTKNGDLKKSGHWTFGPDGNLYVSSGNTNQILRYTPDGKFQDIFVDSNSGGLDGPKDLAFDNSGNLYVSSGNTNQILRYTPDGKFQDIFVDSNSGGLDGPKDLAFDNSGNLYVSSDNSILGFDGKTGSFLNNISIRDNELVSGLTFGPDGNLYVSSGNTDQILRYTPDGKFQDIFVDSNSGGLDGPKDLAFDDDYFYVTSFLNDEVLQYYSDSGDFVTSIVSSHDGDIKNPKYTIFGPDGNLYISSDNRVLRFDGKTGLFLDDFVPLNSGGLNLSTGLAFDNTGNLYVSSGNTDQILRYTPDGKFQDIFVDSSFIKKPQGLTFGPDGNLYVSSGNTDQILRYTPDGKFQDIFVDSSFIKKPQGLTFGPDGNLYVSSYEYDVILLFDGKTGAFIDVFASSGGLDGPIGLAFDNTGNLYVSSGNTNQVLRYSNNGEFEGVLIDSAFIKSPNGLTFGPDGNLYAVSSDTNEIIKSSTNVFTKPEKFVTDQSSQLDQPHTLKLDDEKICVSNYFSNDIYCYDKESGKSLGILVKSFNRGLVAKANSIVGLDDKLYVSNNLSGEISRFDDITGHFTEVAIRTQADRLFSPSNLAFGPDGNLYVSSDDKIFRFDGNTGDFQDIFITETMSAGLDNPQGLSFDGDSLFVSSYDNNRVLRYDSKTGDFIEEFVKNKVHGLFGPIGNVVNEGNLYVTNTVLNEILQYDISSGHFLKSIKLNSSPQTITFDNDNIFVSHFAINEVRQYDTLTGKSDILLSGANGLSGPNGLAYDSKNKILYVSSSKNNKLFAYDMQTKTFELIKPSFGEGILQYPQGLFFYNDNLYIANSNNNEILEYDPETQTLSSFVHDFSDTIRAGGIAFDLNSVLYMINEIDNKIYKYDIKNGGLLGIFTPQIHPLLIGEPSNIPLRDIVFTKKDQYLFASSPSHDMLLAYDGKTGAPINEFFKKTDVLNFPTKLVISPDGKYLLVANFGSSEVIRFKVSGEFDRIFSTPGNDGLSEIRNMMFGQDGNLYLISDDPNNLLKYDGKTGQFLGTYDIGSNYLGILSENPLSVKYLLNEIDTQRNNVVVIEDQFSEKKYATITLQDNVDFITPITTAANSFSSMFIVIQDPKLQSKEFVKNTGFFIGLNDVEAYGQVKSKSIDHTSLITIENFFINYDRNEYVSTNLSDIRSNGPELVACLIPSTSGLECGVSDSIELGNVKINAGDNNFLIPDVDLTKYQNLVVYDKTLEKTFANVPLREYGTLRISAQSFADWFQHYLPVFPIISIVIMIFPITWDYIRTGFKIIFFAFHILFNRSRIKQMYLPFSPKITILIPAHNEEYGIKKSIETALSTEYPNKEVIVIDDGSKDNTFLIANSFAEQGLIKLIHRTTASGSKATALNYGMNYATGDYVLCMDGDTLLDKNALKNAAKHLTNKDVVAVSGNVRILSGDDGVHNLLTKLQTYEYMIAIELGRRFTSFFQILLVISGAFGIFKRTVIGDVHTFDKDTLTEDFDLTLKLRKTKGRIRFVGDSIAYTYCPNNWPTWVKQRNRWAFGQFQTLSKNKNMLTRKFPFKDRISFFDMFVLDIILAMLFPIGLTVLGTISVILYLADNLHILVYSMTFVMILFMISELVIFLFAIAYSGKSSYLRLFYLVPIMTFFYRPYLKMVNLRAYLRAYFGKKSSW